MLKDYLETVSINKEVLSGMSNCMFGLVRRLVQFTCLKTGLEHERKIALGPILKVLIHCLALPEYNRYTRFKMDIYGAILCLIEECTEPTAKENLEAIESYLQNESKENGGDANKVLYDGGNLHNSVLKSHEDSLEALLHRRAAVVNSWASIFNEHSAELIKICTSDIDFAPFDQKILAMTCLAEILREGQRTNRGILEYVRQAGVVKLVIDSLSVNFKLDFDNEIHENRASLLYMQTFLVS